MDDTTNSGDAGDLVDGGGSASGAGAGGAGTSGAGEGGGDESRPWHAGLPEDAVTDKVKSFKDVEGLVRAYNHAQSLIGKKGVVPPGEKATPAERAQFFRQLGAPEKADGYTWKPPEGVEMADDKANAAARERLLALGLNQEQFGGVMDLYVSEMKAMTERQRAAQVEQRQSTVKALGEEWGGDYDRNLAQAQAAIRRFGVAQTLKEQGLGNNAEVLRMFAKIGQELGEDRLASGGQRPAANPQARIAELKASKAYMDRNSPDHESVMSQLQELYRRV